MSTPSPANTLKTTQKPDKEGHASEYNAVAYGRFALHRGAQLLASQRACAFASEVGESARPIVHPKWVKAAYGLSWAYVIADTGLQTVEEYKSSQKDTRKTLIRGADTAGFHAVASMAIPALTIHTVVHQSAKVLQKPFWVKQLANLPRLRGPLPTLIGLASIPLIVHPIDQATHWVMNQSVRKLYPDMRFSSH